MDKKLYWTIRVKVHECVSDPLVAVTVTWKLPVGVPEVTPKFIALDAPPPGAGLETTTGKLPWVCRYWDGMLRTS